MFQFGPVFVVLASVSVGSDNNWTQQETAEIWEGLCIAREKSGREINTNTLNIKQVE